MNLKTIHIFAFWCLALISETNANKEYRIGYGFDWFRPTNLQVLNLIISQSCWQLSSAQTFPTYLWIITTTVRITTSTTVPTLTPTPTPNPKSNITKSSKIYGLDQNIWYLILFFGVVLIILLCILPILCCCAGQNEVKSNAVLKMKRKDRTEALKEAIIAHRTGKS